MSLDPAYGLRFGDNDDVLVYALNQSSSGADADRILSVPRRSLIIPSMPAILETRLLPSSFPSLSLMSPEGLSTTRVGDDGDEGEEKA